MAQPIVGDVDLALVLALDVSYSVDAQEFLLMRNGLASALDTTEVEKALLSGWHGAILVSVVQWSGFQEQAIKITWTRVTNRADLAALANASRKYDSIVTKSAMSSSILAADIGVPYFLPNSSSLPIISFIG